MAGRAYSPWLTGYKVDLRNNLYDILAGTLSLRLKVQEDFYTQHKIRVQQPIDTWIANVGSATILKHPITANDLNVGFDEILLLDIFRPFVSIPFESNMLNGDSIITKYNSTIRFIVEAMIFSKDIINLGLETMDVDIILTDLINKGYIISANSAYVNDKIEIASQFFYKMNNQSPGIDPIINAPRPSRWQDCGIDVVLYGIDSVPTVNNYSILTLANQEYSKYFVYDDTNPENLLYDEFVK